MIWTVAGVGCDEIVRANPRGRLYSRWHENSETLAKNAYLTGKKLMEPKIFEEWENVLFEVN